MSAFVVGKAHIDLLVSLAMFGPAEGRFLGGRLRWYPEPVGRDGALYDREAVPEAADAIGQMLLEENVRSVRHRYRDNRPEDMVPDYARHPYRNQTVMRRPPAVMALKAVRCYQYQSCEHPGWKTSEAAAFCEALTGWLVPMLPGYDAAPWEWVGREEVMAR